MMKYYFFLLVTGSIMAICLTSQSRKKVDVETEIALKTNRLYTEQLDSLLSLLNQLEIDVATNKGEDQLKNSFLASRNQFKTCEFLLCYVNSDEARRINGANITINEFHNLTPMEEKPPHGLQVIEDLIYNPSETSREELSYEIKLLKDLIELTSSRAKSESILRGYEYNVIVWDAIRMGLFRIETMGITGFDVPESLNSLPETTIALESILEYIQLYEKKFKVSKQKKSFEQGILMLQSAHSHMLAQTDFNQFDRLHFMTEHLHPLSKWVHRSISHLQYEYPTNTRAIDNNASYLFDENFFNITFFNLESTPEKIALGEKLFNDPVLSKDGTRSCFTCHQQDKAFTDGVKKNTSLITQEELERNTPTLINSVFQTRFFYDSRAKRMEIQIQDVIQNPHEMGGDLSLITEKLKENEHYQSLFDVAYKGKINKTTILNAISTYVKSLVGFNSRFDQYIRGDSTALNDSEKNGFNLFAGKAKCATCHFAPMFNGLLPPHYRDNESEILGVPFDAKDPKTIDTDLGKYNATKLDLHRNSFKTVSIRNIEKTAPYMHNGVFASLEEVVEFYEKGGGVGQGMQLNSQTLPDSQLKLTESEKKDLVNFMKSLND